MVPPNGANRLLVYVLIALKNRNAMKTQTLTSLSLFALMLAYTGDALADSGGSLSAARMANGAICLSCPTVPGQSYLIQATTNLSQPQWTTICVTNAGSNLMMFVDVDAASHPCRFYRLAASCGFTGFLSPIDGGDTTGGSSVNPIRSFKLGSTIPVKFQMSCAGSSILSGVPTLQALKFSSVTTSEVPIDATPTDAATTGNQFRLTENQWHYNLSTKSGFSEGTWQLVATLSDGSTHYAWITLKQ